MTRHIHDWVDPYVGKVGKKWFVIMHIKGVHRILAGPFDMKIQAVAECNARTRIKG